MFSDSEVSSDIPFYIFIIPMIVGIAIIGLVLRFLKKKPSPQR